MLFSFLFCSSYLSIIKLYILFRSACFYFFSYFCKNEIKVQLRFRCFVLSKNIFLSTFNRIRAKAFCFFQFLERKASVDEYSDDVLVWIFSSSSNNNYFLILYTFCTLRFDFNRRERLGCAPKLPPFAFLCKSLVSLSYLSNMHGRIYPSTKNNPS